jgi:hypothetical protein
MNSSQACPLCAAVDSLPFYADARRRYWRCQRCQLVFVPASYQLSAAAELAVYQQHENHMDDPGYRQFLNRAAQPLLARLPATGGALGIDIGCGPGPLLAKIITEAGHHCDYSDPLFYPERTVGCGYDFITLTEVVEHMANPSIDLLGLAQRLKAGGWLVVMTKRVADAERFAGWHYKNDPTHISFFSDATLSWVAGQWGVNWESAGSDVAVFGPFY